MFISKKNFYVKQPSSLKAIIFQIKFLNLKKKRALYGLKQALRAWYERPSKKILFVLKGFNIGKIYSILFLKYKNNDLIIM